MIDFAPARQALKSQGLDAWVLFDFRGSNQYYVELFGHAFTTRRVFVFVYADREPVALVHHVDAGQLPAELPKRTYRGQSELLDGLRDLCAGLRKIAMEYSPMGALPTASYVDGGTLDRMRGFGLEVVSSAELYQRLYTTWTPEQLTSHRRSARLLTEIVQGAFRQAGEQLGEIDEYALHRYVRERFDRAGLFAEDGPIVAVNAHAGDPHYHPLPAGSATIGAGDWVLIDLWACEPGGVYADITWVGYAGDRVPDRYQEVFEIARGGRDAGVALLRDRHAAGQPVHGYEVDAAARRHIADRGYGECFTHRLGHSIGFRVHANGVNMDDFETHDTRPVVPGSCFSIEPGIYLPDFGVRTEIDVFMHESGPEVTTPAQTEVFLFGR